MFRNRTVCVVMSPRPRSSRRNRPMLEYSAPSSSQFTKAPPASDPTPLLSLRNVQRHARAQLFDLFRRRALDKVSVAELRFQLSKIPSPTFLSRDANRARSCSKSIRPSSGTATSAPPASTARAARFWHLRVSVNRDFFRPRQSRNLICTAEKTRSASRPSPQSSIECDRSA